MNRRQFLQASAAAGILSALAAKSEAQTSGILDSGSSLKFSAANYTWDWSAEHDQFRILNPAGKVITAGPLQPVILVQAPGKGPRRAISGKLQGHQVQGNRVSWTYASDAGRLTVAWRLEDNGLWVEPAVYESTAGEDIVSINYFAQAAGDAATPALETRMLVVPGACESEGISPILDSNIGLNTRTSLGHTGTGLGQQWGLPAHYFAGFRVTSGGATYEPQNSQDSQAFCCGLSEIPAADLYLEQSHGQASVLFDYRGDLWGHMRGPGKFSLGAGLFWAPAPNYYEAIRNYYRGLLAAGLVHKKVNSARKNAAMLSPQWCTWGQQVIQEKDGNHLDQATLEQFYRDLKASGLRAGMFSIDDQWEGKYGNLSHSVERFPQFEQFLDQVRADGMRLGMWAAFMRCEDPASLGLTPEQMLHTPDGKAFFHKQRVGGWYLLDFTRPEVEKVLRERAREFVRRYKPDLVKFDFGYEIPVLEVIAPHDMRYAGERMLAKGLEVVVGAMREANPDIVLMYYHLSPLLTEYLDLHSPDDLFMAKGEYELETNRRFFFCGLCAEFGMPTYGSTGYDWASAPEIWFDSVVVGTVGALAAFVPNDDAGGKATPEIIAKYNGFTQLVRPTNQFTVQPLDPVFAPPTRGAHASSWVRMEDGKPVLVALRPQRLDGGRGRNEYDGIVSTTAAVVVASRTADALDRATQLAVVPYGEGQLTLRRKPQAFSAEIIEHYFGGKSQASRVSGKNGSLAVPLRQSGDGGQPIEWISIEIKAEKK